MRRDPPSPRSSGRCPERSNTTRTCGSKRGVGFSTAMAKWVYDFSEGSREMRDLLGGKGANVAEMKRIGGPVRVPDGFTITTEACVAYMRARRAFRRGSSEQVAEALARLEEQTGKRLGDPEDPLLVSVRSGARESMPGMMDTVLNLGLNDHSVEGLAERTQQRAVRLGLLPPVRADVRQRGARHRRRRRSRTRSRGEKEKQGVEARHATWTRPACGDLTSDLQADLQAHQTGEEFPQRAARSSCARRSGRCSTRGTASVRWSTGA